MRILVVSGSRMKSTKDSAFKAKMKHASGGEGGIRKGATFIAKYGEL